MMILSYTCQRKSRKMCAAIPDLSDDLSRSHMQEFSTETVLKLMRYGSGESNYPSILLMIDNIQYVINDST